MHIVAHRVDNRPTNFVVSRTFRSRLIGQYVSDASRVSSTDTDGKPRGTALSRGSIFTVLILVLRVSGLLSWSWSLSWPSLSWSWSCPYCLGLVPLDQDSSRHLMKSASNLPTHQKPSYKVLDSDQSWGLWPRWISSHLYPPTIPRSVATLLEVMVCACSCYFCTGYEGYSFSKSWVSAVDVAGPAVEQVLAVVTVWMKCSGSGSAAAVHSAVLQGASQTTQKRALKPQLRHN